MKERRERNVPFFFIDLTVFLVRSGIFILLDRRV